MSDRPPVAASPVPALPLYVKPGEVHWSPRPQIFKTVLGSCVSVCLWDQALRIGGLNHFILPHARGGESDARFGDVAIPRLVDAMAALGCMDLVAKVFGGAAVLPGGAPSTVGDANTQLALAWLGQHGIPVVAQRTGGAHGIVMRFWSDTGAVELREITPATQEPASCQRDAVSLAARAMMAL